MKTGPIFGFALRGIVDNDGAVVDLKAGPETGGSTSTRTSGIKPKEVP
jgi:hypothetical protein